MSSSSPEIRKALRAAADQLGHWMRTASWPLWWSHGRLPNGAFREVLDFDGSPVEAHESRVRVQARQVFSFALARQLGWSQANLEADLSESLRRFRSTCFRNDGVAGRRIDVDKGHLVDDTPDLYDNAFCLLALAACRKVLDPALTETAWRNLVDAIDTELAVANDQGYREWLPPPSQRRQNPHMHLFESLLLLFDATGDQRVGQKASGLFAFIEDRFFDRSRHIVQEEVDDDGAAASDYEPGHSMEWVWLLGYRSRLFDLPLHEFAPQLYRRYVGADIPEGRTPMTLDMDNAPVDGTRRLWSQTESLKAHLCMAELGPPDDRLRALERATRCANAIAGEWLADVADGGWRDHFDEQGNCIARNMPASTGYHLYLAIAELERVAQLPVPAS